MSRSRQKRKKKHSAAARAAADSQVAQVAQEEQTPELMEALEAEALADQIEAAEHEKAESEHMATLTRVVEALLFASDRPLTIARLKQLAHEKKADRLKLVLDGLVTAYTDRGIVLHEVAGGYQFRTHPVASSFVQQLIAGRPVRLTRAQLETLAITAYRQPITRPEIEEIRGVDSGSSLRVLLERNVIRVLGKKEEPGRPLLYGTTKEFLEFFNLNELSDLPTLREFQELSEDSLREVEERLGADAVAEPSEPEPEPSEQEPESSEQEPEPSAEEVNVTLEEFADDDAEQHAESDDSPDPAPAEQPDPAAPTES